MKVALVDRLRRPPDLIVFGSSRALKANPAYLRRKLGETGFNAAVSDGRPEDAWAFLNLLHARFPRSHPHYLWLVDVESFRGSPDPGLLDTPALARFVPFRERWRQRLDAAMPLLSWQEARASLGSCAGRGSGRRSGSGARLRAERLPALRHPRRRLRPRTHARAGARASEALYASVYSRYRGLSPVQMRYFERTLARMDAWGEPPVIVLTPLHPAMRRALAPLGWTKRRQQVLEFLAGLRARHRFEFLDLTLLSSFGGSPDGFYDGFHLTLPNMHRLLDAVVRRERNAL